MALLIHSYYVAGVTNFGDFIADLKAPLCVEDHLMLDLDLTTIVAASEFSVLWEVCNHIPQSSSGYT